MKRSVSLSWILLAILLIGPAHAQSERLSISSADLSFEDSTAQCEVIIFGNNSKDSIAAVITLWNNNQCIMTWERKSNYSLYFSETIAVTQGQSYTLIVEYSINDIPQSRLSSTGTCK